VLSWEIDDDELKCKKLLGGARGVEKKEAFQYNPPQS
jgi:hypothetical protein